MGLNTVKIGGTESQPFSENERLLLTYEHASKLLGLSVTTLKLLKRNGQIPYVPIAGRTIRFRKSALEQWLADREISA